MVPWNGHGMHQSVTIADSPEGSSFHNGDSTDLICTYATTDNDDATVPVSNGMDTSDDGDIDDAQDGSNEN